MGRLNKIVHMCVCIYRHATVLKQALQGSVPQSKVEQAKEEVEDAMAKMEQTRVSYKHFVVVVVVVVIS